MLAKTILVNCLLAAALLSGCQSMTDRSAIEPDRPEIARVWPQPPLPARIRFITAVARPADLGIKPSFFGRVIELILGKEEAWLIRPAGIVADEQTIFIADAGAQALWIVNQQAGRFEKIQEAGGRRLISPVAVAFGPQNRVYLADSYLAKVFVWDGGGKFIGTIADPRFIRPAGLAYDRERGRLYVADSAAHRIWLIAADGKPAGEIGARGAAPGQFNFPTHVALDRAGYLYVNDTLNFRLQIFEPGGKFAGQLGQHGDSSGELASPKGIAVDSEGHVHVADALFDAVQIFDRQGRYLLTFGERGTRRGEFWLPAGVFIDARDRIYVADAYNQRIQIFQYLAGADRETQK